MEKSNKNNITSLSEETVVPIGGFPSIIPKDLYNEIMNDFKRGKTSNSKTENLSISKILEDTNKPYFLFGGDEDINII